MSKKIKVSYCFEVRKTIDIDVNELVDFYFEKDNRLEDVVEKYIDYHATHYLTVDDSSEIDTAISDCYVFSTIEQTDDDLNDVEVEDFTIEDLNSLNKKNIREAINYLRKEKLEEIKKVVHF